MTIYPVVYSADTADLIPPTTEEWGTEEWTPAEQVHENNVNQEQTACQVNFSHFSLFVL